jgi:hypothetical protein
VLAAADVNRGGGGCGLNLGRRRLRGVFQRHTRGLRRPGEEKRARELLTWTRLGARCDATIGIATRWSLSKSAAARMLWHRVVQIAQKQFLSARGATF